MCFIAEKTLKSFRGEGPVLSSVNLYKPVVSISVIVALAQPCDSLYPINLGSNCSTKMRPSLFLSLAVAAVAQAAVVPRAAAASGLKWLGVSESVAEFGTALPGTWGVDFYFPSTTTIDVRPSQWLTSLPPNVTNAWSY